ncbi:MAG: diguanylate cyclase [Acidobacteriia bacterium]|nr:diguanylate cyclase [Terriglobia bacterium]
MDSGAEWDLFRTVVDNLWEGVFIVDRSKRLRYWSRGAERLTGYSVADMAGKPACDAFPIHELDDGTPLCTGPCPVALTLADGIPREASHHIHHKAGHRFPARIRTTALKNPAGRILGVVESFTEAPTGAWALARICELEELAHVDPLTGLANRRAIEVQINRSLGELVRFGWPFGVVILDLDGFKQVNDDHGHRFGDGVLKLVARELAQNSRRSDVLGRWGGDEFLGVIKNVDERQLEFVARKLSSSVEKAPLHLGSDLLHISVSAGASAALASDTLDSLVARADQRMYEAKNATRSRPGRGSIHMLPAARSAKGGE